jgi:hypothetical protein
MSTRTAITGKTGQAIGRPARFALLAVVVLAALVALGAPVGTVRPRARGRPAV